LGGTAEGLKRRKRLLGKEQGAKSIEQWAEGIGTVRRQIIIDPIGKEQGARRKQTAALRRCARNK